MSLLLSSLSQRRALARIHVTCQAAERSRRLVDGKPLLYYLPHIYSLLWHRASKRTLSPAEDEDADDESANENKLVVPWCVLSSYRPFVPSLIILFIVVRTIKGRIFQQK